MTRLPHLHYAAQFDVQYRHMTDSDMAFLSALYRSTREDELNSVPWSDAEKNNFIAMQFDAQHTHYQKHYPDALWLIIAQEQTPIGRLYLERWTSEHRIIDIALTTQTRAKGIGTAILRDLQTEAASANKKIGIHVEKVNPAMTLYHRLGFKAVEDKGVYDLLEWTPALR